MTFSLYVASHQWDVLLSDAYPSIVHECLKEVYAEKQQGGNKTLLGF